MMGSVRTSRYLLRSVIGTSAVMSELQSATLVRKFAHEDSNPANTAFAGKLQQTAILANENCDRATALAHTLSAELREAQNRINRLELEADGLVDRLRAEAKTAVAKLQSEADACVDRTNRQAEERIARQEAEAKNLVSRLQGELALAKQGAERVKAESDARIERIKIEADERVARAQAEAEERLDRARAEIEGQFSRLEADVAQARQRADRAEQWLVQIRREIEGHLMPSFGAVHGRGANERRK
jgi:chromosome segregation ATPase